MVEVWFCHWDKSICKGNLVTRSILSSQSTLIQLGKQLNKLPSISWSISKLCEISVTLACTRTPCCHLASQDISWFHNSHLKRKYTHSMIRLQKDSDFWKLVQISCLKFQSRLSSAHVDQISNEGGVVVLPDEMWRMCMGNHSCYHSVLFISWRARTASRTCLIRQRETHPWRRHASRAP